MWINWMKENWKIAGAFAILSIFVLVSAVDGIGARRAARQYFDRAWEWAKAYDRDTAASKKEYEAKIKILTADRDTYRKKYEVAKRKMNAPWVAPKNPGEIEERFLKMGYRGTLK